MTPEQYAHYRRLLGRTGNEQYARRIAFGTSVRVPAYTNSAGSFHRQARANGETVGQMFAKNPQGLAELKREAAKMGISVSDEDCYYRSLAMRGGRPDPEAVVPHDDPLGHVVKLAHRRGHGLDGRVHVDAPEPIPVEDTGPPIAEDIIDNLVKQEAEKDPGLVETPARVEKLREDIINRHAPPPSCCGDKPPSIEDLL
jgi:hypothetical protein